MAKELTKKADDMRKEQQWAAAAVLYEEAWHKEASPYIARWLIYCRRKAGELNRAAETAKDALNRFPDHSYLKTEYAWVLYDGPIREARERGNIDQLIACAEEALQLSADELFVTRVAQTVVKKAKSMSPPPWEIVADWAAMINPVRLSDQKRTTGEGKTFMSEREEWYVGLAKALLETGNHGEARRIAQEGLQNFPGEIFLLRTSALACYHGGDHEAGAAEMRALQHLPRFDWYMKAELAEMEAFLGNTSLAYRLVCQALGNRQDDKYKLHYFWVLADLALQLKKLEVAAAHVSLIRAIRTNEGWKIPPGLEDLETRINDALTSVGASWPLLPEKMNELSRYCRELRRAEGLIAGSERGGAEVRKRSPGRETEGGVEEERSRITKSEKGDTAAAVGMRLSGTVLKIDPARPFTFINPDDGGEAIFVTVRDLPPTCAHAGAHVTFSLAESFDRKKNRASVRATQIEPL
ncbi:MAG: tetratricopeptide repeat protein [Syntrophobacterales bacterium]|nr:tetratricopeptide repeat protein [Syntrophobacterales bacterium]